MRRDLLLVLVTVAALAVPLPLHAQDGDASDPNVTVIRESANTSRILIRAPNGHIDWRDVVRGIARSQQLDDDVLRPYLPSGEFNLSRKGIRFQLLALNLSLPGVRMRVMNGDTNEGTALEIKIDKDDFESVRRRVTRLIRREANDNGVYDRALGYGLRLESEAAPQRVDRPLVVVVHGLNSRPQYLEGLAEGVEDQGLTCATYGYPNDEPISDAAKRLSSSLKAHAAEFPEQKLILVTNSMGGLAARAVIEDASLDPGNVAQLIMIAPPNHGSLLARVAHGLDLWEFLLSAEEQDEVSWCRASIIDGLAEANRDLRPGSRFLCELNARERNRNVRYTILLGTGGPLHADRLVEIRSALKSWRQRSRLVRLFYPLVDEFLHDLDELVCGKGDGAVAIQRGRLDGVDDVVVLDFKHSAALGRNKTDVHPEILATILSRLKSE